MCDLNAIYKNGTEYSLEELRVIESGFDFTALSRASRHDIQPRKPAPVASVSEYATKQTASPTINTKAAMEDVFEMFNQPIAEQVWEDEDETISAKVYRPEAFKIGVFRDSDDDTPTKADIQVKEAMYSVNNFDYEIKIPEDKGYDISAKTPKVPPRYPFQSTPFSDHDSEGGLTSDSKLDPVPQTVMRPSLRTFDIMTPITEVSEDRTFAGLSTIQSEKTHLSSLSSLSCEDSTGSTRSFLARNKMGLEQDSHVLLTDLERGVDHLDIDPADDVEEAQATPSLPLLQEDGVESVLEQGSLIHQAEDEDCAYEMMDIPNPCNPRDPSIIQAILESVDIPENSGLHSHLNLKARFTDQFSQALSRSKSKESGGSTCSFELPSTGNFKLAKKLGEGSFGSVYLVRKLTPGLMPEEDEFFQGLDELQEDENFTFAGKAKGASVSAMAFKVQSPPAPWEFYILSVLRSRLPKRINDSIIKPTSCHLYQDESGLLMEYANQGSLLECVNLAHKGGYGAGSGSTMQPGQGGLDELLAAFWTIEILRTIETVHAAGMMHGDIKVRDQSLTYVIV